MNDQLMQELETQAIGISDRMASSVELCASLASASQTCPADVETSADSGFSIDLLARLAETRFSLSRAYNDF